MMAKKISQGVTWASMVSSHPAFRITRPSILKYRKALDFGLNIGLLILLPQLRQMEQKMLAAVLEKPKYLVRVLLIGCANSLKKLDY